jgi:hypothetical protein
MKFWDDIADFAWRNILMAAPPSNDGFGFGGEPAKNPAPTQNTVCSMVMALQKNRPLTRPRKPDPAQAVAAAGRAD